MYIIENGIVLGRKFTAAQVMRFTAQTRTGDNEIITKEMLQELIALTRLN